MTGSNAREKILRVANRLFYQNGYRATAVNQIIEEAAVAKATFYSHFKSKEALGLAYLDLRESIVFRAIKGELDRLARSPLDKALALFTAQEHYHLRPADFQADLEEAAREDPFRGCPFIKIDMESPSERIRERVQTYKGRIVKAIKHLLADAVEAGELRPDADTDQLALRLSLLSFGAAIQAGWDPQPIHFREAAAMAEQLLAPWRTPHKD